jgi:hypothetical protein
MPAKTCVIGAGSSGMVAVKALADAGLPCDCFEETGEVGGLWVFGNGRSTAYSSLSINTSRQRMQYADFAMPAHYPDYPGHAQIAQYFRAYVERFELRRHIRFRTRVERVEPLQGGGFAVKTSDGVTAEYGAVVVANGHHWKPHYPEPPFPGAFAGTSLHSSEYRGPKTPHDFSGERVVVLGFGNSAVDIACELATGGARRVMLATRRGAWVLPKYVLGKPVDQLGTSTGFLPPSLGLRLSELLYPLVIGNLRALGLPKPDHPLGGAHPTLSSDLLPLIKAGRVIPKPNLRALHGHELEFADGSREPVDALVYATGYSVSFPFFDEAFVSAPNNELALYFRTLHPEHAGLYFIGLAQPVGAIMPIAEAQAKLVADCIAGRYAPPAPATMREEAMAERQDIANRYVASRRHTMQVDFDAFMAALKREHAEGRKRAGRQQAPA